MNRVRPGDWDINYKINHDLNVSFLNFCSSYLPTTPPHQQQHYQKL